ncbi:hypothetical protein [Rothia sp. (in: high G+C Gram-positive bacteria)]|uniref:hypothetical protein n=1 Tax=Rothia sp. (in: high G+C Gram-positive bacteria) TaxID=1885016 RepID=UPI000ED247ED|nr:hypothetical protein [Rothia sp. (in: high G+C Gram-positive bacteria)]
MKEAEEFASIVAKSKKLFLGLEPNGKLQVTFQKQADETTRARVAAYTVVAEIKGQPFYKGECLIELELATLEVAEAFEQALKKQGVETAHIDTTPDAFLSEKGQEAYIYQEKKK